MRRDKDVVEEVEEEEEEGETRCICGEMEPPDDSGFFIQCEQCNVWQHGVCVGISDTADSKPPDKYWCEQCRPELHRLYYTSDTGELRSAYKPVLENKSKNRRGGRGGSNSRRRGSDGVADQSDSESSSATSGSRKKRKTSNGSSTGSATGSRARRSKDEDEEVNNTAIADTTVEEDEHAHGEEEKPIAAEEEQEEHVKEESNEESRNVKEEQDKDLTTEKPAETEAIEKDTSETQNSRAEEQEEQEQEEQEPQREQQHEQEIPPNDTAINDNKVNDEIPNEDEEAVNSTEHSIEEEEKAEDLKKLNDRKRATLLAREEKQYQWMLEKALKESRKTSNRKDDAEDTEEPAITENKDDKDLPDEEANKDASVRNNNSSSNQIHETDDNVNTTSDETTKTKDGTPASSSEDQGKKKPQRKTQRGPARTSSRSKNNRRQQNRNTQDGTNDSKVKPGEIGINKPVKPRLPPPRTTLNEMRRRMSAIMEFLSRTQWELEEENRTQDELTKFVENEEFTKKVKKIFETNNENLKYMDELTKQLIQWDSRYSNNLSLDNQ